MLVSLIVDVVYSPTATRCAPLERISGLCKILACGCTLILLVVCSWAMFDRSKILLGICGTLSLALLITDGISVMLDDCSVGKYASKAAFLWIVSNTITQVAFDSIVMSLVVYNAFCAVALEGSMKALKRRSIANLILWDGTVYLTSVFVLSAAHVLLSFMASGPMKKIALPLIQPTSAIITSYFLLNMRHMEVYPNGSSATAMLLTTMGFGLATTVDPAPPKPVKRKRAWDEFTEDFEKKTHPEEYYDITCHSPSIGSERGSDSDATAVDLISPMTLTFDIEEALPRSLPAAAFPDQCGYHSYQVHSYKDSYC